MYNILICDDERDIVSALKIYLSGEEYRLFEAYDGEEALSVIASNDIHLVLLDIMMPKMDGIKTIGRLRETSNIPVIFLTAKGEDTDKILGLNVGADDYITKPFNPVELQARVKSQLRRYMVLGSAKAGDPKDGADRSVYTAGDIELDDAGRRVTLQGEEVSLTPKEFGILRLLIMNKGRVYSPREIYEAVWNERAYGAENTVAVHVRHLREKLEYDPENPRHIRVIWGSGYKVE